MISHPLRAGGVRAGRAARRLSWGLVDQGASSLTSLFVSIAALRGTADGAGEFAVVFLVHMLAAGFCRSITTEPRAQELPGLSPADVRTHVRAAAIGGVLAGLLSAGLSALIVRPDTAVGVWSLAFTLLVVPTDSVRAAWIGVRRASRAGPISVGQFLAAGAGLVITLVTDDAGWAMVPVVAVSGALLAVTFAPRVPFAPVAARLRPPHWMYAAEWSFTSGLTQSAALVVAALGLPLLPLVIRAQAVLFGPLSSLAQAVAALAVPEFVALRSRRAGLQRAAVGLSAFLLLVSAAYAVVVLLLPDEVVASVLGAAWAHYAPALLASAAAVVTSGLAMGPLVALRAHGAAGASLTSRVVLGTAGLVLPVIGALSAGLPGFFWASAAASVLGGGWALLALRRVERRHPGAETKSLAESGAAR